MYINEKNRFNEDITYDLTKNNNDKMSKDDDKESLKDIKNKKKLELWCPIERKDNYNNELQYYSKNNVVFNNSEIAITSKKEDKDNKSYTSGMIESNYAYLFGNFKFDIQISKGKGIFPAIWLMPSNNSSYPEIDIFEMIGSEPNIFYGVIHYYTTLNEKLRSYFSYEVKSKDNYTIELKWNKDELIWYIDGNIVHRFVDYIPSDYMYIIINQAIGGNWPGSPDIDTIFPNTFIVKNIEIKPVYEKRR